MTETAKPDGADAASVVMVSYHTGPLLVGVLRAAAISVYPEVEMLLIYVIVIGVLVLRPHGLFGAAPA